MGCVLWSSPQEPAHRSLPLLCYNRRLLPHQQPPLRLSTTSWYHRDPAHTCLSSFMQQAKIQATLQLCGALYSCSIRHARDKGQAAVTASWKQPESLAGGQGGDSSSTGAPCVPCLLTKLPAAAARQMTAVAAHALPSLGSEVTVGAQRVSLPTLCSRGRGASCTCAG